MVAKDLVYSAQYIQQLAGIKQCMFRRFLLKPLQIAVICGKCVSLWGASQLDTPPLPPGANADDPALSAVILREGHTARPKGNRVL